MLWTIKTINFDVHIKQLLYAKNHTFYIFFDYILDIYKMNDFSMIEQINLLIDDEELSKLHFFNTIFKA